ncbi:hypothetical protein JW835_07800 [bacterium]|nr:hypothetical protein [bacterium]
MQMFWLFLYNIIAVPLMWIIFHLLAIRNPKIRKGIQGRKALYKKLASELSGYPVHAPCFWIHNSSMGEFEQARPLIRELKKKFTDCVILVTFFSPSGLEHVKDGDGADIISYMPFDSFFDARRFVRLVRPRAAIVVRHEFWPNHLCRLNREGIPVILINASIRHENIFRYPFVISGQRFLFRCFDAILSVSQETLGLLKKYNLYAKYAELAGDTRYDQVVERARKAETAVASLRQLKGSRCCLVAGSTWPSDEAVLFPALAQLKSKDLLPWIVLVPHEPTEKHLSQAELALHQFELSTCRFSELQKSGTSCDVLIVDRVGLLASLYALGDIAFVGGGFGPGVHQVLEPAALGLVVFYGPRSTNSYEAGFIQKRGVGFVVDDSNRLYDQLSLFLKSPKQMETMGQKAAALVRENIGASKRIVACLEHHFFHDSNQ